jgi:ppGpp synthetase/RelA/SpoT-type nucleotidyltranferase
MSTDEAIASRMVRAQRAQREAELGMRAALLQVEKFFSYRLLFVPRTIKSRERIRQKLNDLRTRVGDKAAPDLLDLLTDLAGGRILVIGVRDLSQALEFVCEQLREAGWSRDGEFETYIETAKKPGGFRGAKALVRVPQSPGTFPFELQAMSYLQHTWDLLQHHVYEERRRGIAVSRSVEEHFESFSDRLYAVDCEIDSIRADLQ